MSVVKELIDSLKERGVKYVFGIEGGSWIPYMEEMRNNGIEFILVANEASAGIMADVCFRITGIPGVCYATYGPGATNLSTGVGCAFLDRSAIIAFTSEFNDDQLGKRVQMNVDHQALFSGITKWTFRLESDRVRESVNDAFDFALSEVPGPVHIGIHSEIVVKRSKTTLVDKVPETFSSVDPDSEKLKLLEKTLRSSARPIIAAGLTASRLKLGEKLRKLLDLHHIPIVLTPMAKGLVPHDHECYSGVLFHAMSRQLKEIYNKSDLVIGIGYDPVEFEFEDWMPDVPLINIDTTVADVSEDIDLVCDINCNIGEVLDFMTSVAPVNTEWDFNEIKKIKEYVLDPPELKGNLLGPIEVLRILREKLPADGIMTCDVGAHTHLIGQIWEVENPGMLIMTNGWSSMGFGIPSAIAAKLILPDKKVVCVTGDGGFMMMAGEIVTARRLGLNVVFIILADGELGLIRVKQDNIGVTNYGVKLYDGDFINEDTFFGVPVETVRKKEELSLAIEAGFERVGPQIIEVVTDGSEYNSLISGNFK